MAGKSTEKIMENKSTEKIMENKSVEKIMAICKECYNAFYLMP